jgi:NAD(P)-dependent dehydrogenase (short-subunit alcohol dehydrogenase family)
MGSLLEDKVSLVTGAAVGIGRESALAFAREGSIVVLADVLVEEGEVTADLVRDTGGEALFLRCDVSKASEVEAIIDTVVKRYGRLDCAFNNAGWEGIIAPTAECTEENWDQVIAVNLKGVWLCMKYEIKQMQKQKSGSIVNTSSVAGVVAERGFPSYAAAKGGVLQLTRTAAVEYAGTGIRINAICPGVIQTPMMDRAMKGIRISAMAPGSIPSTLIEGVADKVMGMKIVQTAFSKMMQPMGRPGQPEEVAKAAVWLCSDAASFVTGHSLLIDGGMTAA